MIQDIIWHEGTEYPDLVKGGAQGVVFGKLVYAAGMNYPWRESHKTHIFEPERNQWEELPDMPRGCCYTRGVSVKDEFFVIIGRRQLQSLSECFKLTKGNGEWLWEQIPSLHQARAVPALSAVDSLIICVGGGNWNKEKPGAFFPQDVTMVEGFDVDAPNRGWVELAAFPGKLRAGASAAAVKDKVYLFGGYHAWIEADKRRVQRLKDAFCYSPSSDEWTKIADLPYPISGGAAVSILGRYIILLGGAIQLEDGTIYQTETIDRRRNVPVGEYNDRVWAYDTLENNYREMPTRMLHGANDVQASCVDDTIYVAGGENIDKTTSNTMDSLRIGKFEEGK